VVSVDFSENGQNAVLDLPDEVQDDVLGTLDGMAVGDIDPSDVLENDVGYLEYYLTVESSHGEYTVVLYWSHLDGEIEVENAGPADDFLRP
jgi:hypothetical protein